MKLTDITSFFKKFFTKINDFVQWTKKWHLLHCVFITDMFLCSLSISYDISKLNYNDILENLTYGNPLYFYPLSLLLGVILAILIAIIKFIKKQTVNTESKFLLNNPIYNVIYILNLLYILSIALILIVTFFTFNLQEFDEMDNLMAVGFAFWILVLGLMTLVITIVIYTAIIFVLTKIQKHTLIKKDL